MRYTYVCDDDAARNVVDLRREKETLTKQYNRTRIPDRSAQKNQQQEI